MRNADLFRVIDIAKKYVDDNGDNFHGDHKSLYIYLDTADVAREDLKVLRELGEEEEDDHWCFYTG